MNRPDAMNDGVIGHPDAARLEQRLGDPWDESNPLGVSAVLAADERGDVLDAGEALLDELDVAAAFVPPVHGGGLHRLDHLIQLLRAACRRDPCLGFGYGMSSLMAAAHVWTIGSPQQCRHVAGLLLGKGKLACAYHELAHGNDMAGVEFAARPAGGGLLLNGRKEVIGNVGRAKAMVLFARTGEQAGSRCHSPLLIDPAGLPAGRFQQLPRVATSGVRGLQLGGIEFLNCPVPQDAVIGPPGHGVETALRAFQLTRIALSGITVGVLDSALRTTVRYALDRTLYGRAVAELPLPRAVLVDGFVDLLVSDCMASVGARALHCLPGQASVLASAVKSLVPRLLVDATVALSNVIGAQFYLRSGPHALMQKLVRDIQPLGYVHASRASCQLAILAQLPLLAKRSWGVGEGAPPQVFRLGEALPALHFDRLSLSAGGADPLMQALLETFEQLPVGSEEAREIRRLTEIFVDELLELKRTCAELRPLELAPQAARRSYELADRYAVLLAASCCVNVWRHNPAGAGDFMGSPAWIIAALGRLALRLGRHSVGMSDRIRSCLYGELVGRHRAAVSFDLARTPLHPGAGRTVGP
jgi:alkylation response protein AidB-like acyl-CoA dehydrogenase